MSQNGPNTQEIRTFINIFGRAAHKAGILRSTLDEYLKAVHDDPSSDRGNQYRAGVIFKNLLQQAGEDSTLPDYAVIKPPRNRRSTSSKNDAPPKNPPTTQQEEDTQSLKIPDDFEVPPSDDSEGVLAQHEPKDLKDPFFGTLATGINVEGSLFDYTPEPPHPVQEKCSALLDEFIAQSGEYFIRVFWIDTVRYVAVGSIFGTLSQGPNSGKRGGLHYVLGNLQTVQDSKEKHAYHVNGVPLEVKKTDPKTNLCKSIMCLKYEEGLKIRYWTRIGEKEVPNSKKVFVITDGEVKFQK
jgi:hypothetical protein